MLPPGHYYENGQLQSIRRECNKSHVRDIEKMRLIECGFLLFKSLLLAFSFHTFTGVITATSKPHIVMIVADDLVRIGNTSEAPSLK